MPRRRREARRAAIASAAARAAARSVVFRVIGQVRVGAAWLEGELAGDRGDLDADVGVLVRERGRLAVGERPQPGALDDQRDRARHVDDHRVGLLGGDGGP